MPTETITITVTGANPQTKTVAINVDPTTGAGSTSVTFTGVNGGEDTFVASGTIAGSGYTSNSAFVGWQPSNGTVSLINNLTIAGYTNPGETPTWHGVGTLYATDINKNSVVVNQVYTNGTVGNGVPITGLVTDDGNSGQYAHVPPLLDDVKSDGTALTALGSTLGWGLGAAGDGSFVTFFQGQLVVAQAGIQTFYFLVDESWALYIGGGATRVAGAFTTVPNGSSPSTPGTADQAVVGTSLSVGTWPLMGTRNTSAISVQPSDYVYVNFPAPGVYPFLAWWVNNADAQTYFQMTYAAGSGAIPPSSGNGESGGVIKPVSLQSAPPATTPSGNLQLSLAQSNIQIQGNQITLNVGVSGIVYSTKQYIPLLEGTAGKLFIYNSPSDTFSFQTYNGQPVDNASAATNVFSLSGNNQNLLSVQYNQGGDGSFSLYYGGSAFPAGIPASTQLTVTAEDISWFNAPNRSYDLFSPASLGGPGGIAFSVEVDYMVNPSGYTVSPNNTQADGNTHIFTITLSEPMSPQQIGSVGNTGNTVAVTITSNNGTTAGSPTAQFDTSGNLTGYTVPITVPLTTANGNFQITVTLQGALTYLSGTTFVNNVVTYFANVQSTVSLVGAQFIAPVAYAFSVNPNTTTFSPGGAASPTPIRRATWGTSIVGGSVSSFSAGNTVTIMGEGRGLALPSTLVVGGQVTLSGFVSPFPTGFGVTGQGGSSQAGPLIYTNISGTYTVTAIGTTIVGGSESVPSFSITAPSTDGPTYSYDWGSSYNPPDSGWYFTPSGASSSNPTLSGTVYAFDNNPITMTFYYTNTTTGTPTAIGTGTLSGTSTGTVSGQTVYLSTFQISFVPPTQTNGQNYNLLGFTATDTVSGLSVTYFSGTQYTFPPGISTQFPPITTNNGSYIQSGTTATLYFLDANSNPGGISYLNDAFNYGPLSVMFTNFTGSGGPSFLVGETVVVTALGTAHLSNHDDAYWYIQFQQPSSANISNVGNPAPFTITFGLIPAPGFTG